MTEQRKHPRYEVEVATEVEAGGDVMIASTQNLSEGGAALILDSAVEEDAAVGVTLFLTQDGIEDPDEEPFEARATVMWSAERDDGGYVAGVRFDRLDATQQSQLQRFLAAVDEQQ